MNTYGKDFREEMNKILEEMHHIKYGYITGDNERYLQIDANFSKFYKLQKPEELLKSKLGVCWDQVELERYYFNISKIECTTYFMVYYDKKKCPSHTFLVYKNGNKYNWFENSWEKYGGIHQFNSLNELLETVKNNFIKDELLGEFNVGDLCLFEYKQPNYGISCQEFYKHCESGKKIF